MPRLGFNDVDPFAWVLAPPENETESERVERELREEQATLVSNRIDEEIKVERQALKKRKKAVKVLLLGQSESGKSTTIKNFQLAYNYEGWLEERASWRVVIHLNLVRSVNTILDLLDEEISESVHDLSFSETLPELKFTERHTLLKLRLGPLRQTQKDLEARLGSGSTEPRDLSVHVPLTISDAFLDLERGARKASKEFYVVSNTGWKSALNQVRPRRSTAVSPDQRTPGDRLKSAQRARTRCADDAADVIALCSEDIKALWEDEIVQSLLVEKNIRLEESSGFFLDDLDRIASHDYEPSDTDVVRARLRTMGVQEYRFSLEKVRRFPQDAVPFVNAPLAFSPSLSGRGTDLAREWLMYDVSGTRTSRCSWFPFFDDINALIFLAPISCFDETLAEDSRVNRLEDSFLLWKAVCSSKLLANVHFVLFLNKCDLLAKKLKRQNAKVKDFFPEFKDKTNDFKTVVTFFRHKFKDICLKSLEPRDFYSHFTTVTNTTSTKNTLSAVQEAITRKHLKEGQFI